MSRATTGTPRAVLALLAGLALLAALAILAACGPAASEPGDAAATGTGTGTDADPAAESAIRPAADSEPVRVAVLVPHVADALREVAKAGAGGFELAAVVARSGETVPEGVVDLGSPHHPNLEVLAQADADLVVGDAGLHGARRDQLGRTGTEVMLLDAGSVEESFAGLQRVADRVGAGAAMAERIAAAEAEIERLHLHRPREVLPLFGAPGSFLAITGATFLGDLLDRLGFQNLAAGAPGQETFPGYLQLSDEVLVTLRPDRVLLVTHGDPAGVEAAFRRQAAEGGRWSHLAERVTVLDPELFGDNPGLDAGAAARALVEIFDEADGDRG